MPSPRRAAGTAHSHYRGLRTRRASDVVARAVHQQGVAIGSTSLPTALPLIRKGLVSLIAVAGAERAPKLPGVLKAAEQGFPGFAVSTHFGLVAPARPRIEAFHSFNANLTAFRPLLG